MRYICQRFANEWVPVTHPNIDGQVVPSRPQLIVELDRLVARQVSQGQGSPNQLIVLHHRFQFLGVNGFPSCDVGQEWADLFRLPRAAEAEHQDSLVLV